MRAVILYTAIAVLCALAAYIIRGNSRIASNILLFASLVSFAILGISIVIEQ